MIEHKILVVGGQGSLGQELLRRLPNAIGTSRTGVAGEALDIVDPDQVMEVVRQCRPTCVINTAAMTSVDVCEKERELAASVHVGGTRNLVAACEVTGSRFVHLSTNYVFDGAGGPYDEDDLPNPLSVYGQTKLESESLVMDTDNGGLVIRTAVFYGLEARKPNFVTWALRQLILGRPVSIVTDEWANPTYVSDLAEAIVALVHREASGILHGAGPDFFTRYEMVMAVCDVFGLDRGLVTPVTSDDLGQAAARPPRAGLKTDRIRALLPDVFSTFETNLATLRDDIGDPVVWAQNKI